MLAQVSADPRSPVPDNTQSHLAGPREEPLAVPATINLPSTAAKPHVLLYPRAGLEGGTGRATAVGPWSWGAQE
jgi:hypothetical protein